MNEIKAIYKIAEVLRCEFCVPRTDYEAGGVKGTTGRKALWRVLRAGQLGRYYCDACLPDEEREWIMLQRMNR